VQSFVTSKLSQKLRHIRWLRGVRSNKRKAPAEAEVKKKRKHVLYCTGYMSRFVTLSVSK